MPLRVDPEENEIRALRRVTRWRRKRVLEIGCGDGRLSFRLARMGAAVTAIDPDRALIRKARERLPARFRGRVHFQVGKAARLGFPSHSFDIVIFAWSF